MLQLIGRPLLDDSIYGYLHNRFEVSRYGNEVKFDSANAGSRTIYNPLPLISSWHHSMSWRML